jgi:hypothetical protein
MKRRVWLWLPAGVAAVAVLVFGIFWDLRRKAAVVVERHEKDAAAKFVEIRARSWKREPMFGTEIAGNRWDPFTTALDALDAIPQADLDEIPGMRDDDPDFKPDLARLDAVFAKHQPLVAQLRDAYRRRTLVPPYAYEQNFAMDLPNVSKAIKIAGYLAAAARRLHDLGRDAEAMDQVLLAILLGQDQAYGGPLINHLVMNVCDSKAHRMARTILESHALTARELEALAVSVDRIWTDRPRFSECLGVEDAMDRFGLANIMGSPAMGGLVSGRSMPRSWKYLFSTSLMTAEALNEFEEFFRDASVLDRVALPERLSRADQLVQKKIESKNPLVALILPGLGRAFRREAHAQAMWSLMRASIALARYELDNGKPPSTLDELVPRYLPRVPEDPFSGGPLRSSGGKVWSFGGDGDDDGGRPIVDEDKDDDDGDVVWTVKRK